MVPNSVTKQGCNQSLSPGLVKSEKVLKMSFELEAQGKLHRVQGPALRFFEGSMEGLCSLNSSLLLPQILSLIFSLVNHAFQGCIINLHSKFLVFIFFSSFFLFSPLFVSFSYLSVFLSYFNSSFFSFFPSIFPHWFALGGQATQQRKPWLHHW